MSKNFVPLHAHSIYSIRDAISKVPDYVKKAKELGFPAVALTEHGTLASALQLYTEANKHGIKPIFGNEMYMATRGRHDKEKDIDKYYHITLIAMNNTGWKNLIKLTTLSYESDNYYYKPRIDRELLSKYNEGLICLSGCIGGNLANSILKSIEYDFEDEEGNKSGSHEELCECSQCQTKSILNETYDDVIKWHKKVFGDRYYLEIQNHEMQAEKLVREVIYDLSKKYDIKVVATGDTHFVEEEDDKAHNIMLAIRDKISIHDEKMNKIKYPGNGYNLLSYGDLESRFSEYPKAIETSLEIADRCNVQLDLWNYKLPHVVDPMHEDEIFRQKVYEGLHERFGKDLSIEIIDRAEEEINVISQMTFPSYFLIISDYISWAKKSGILIGPARGSAAGSIVAYALRITDVNPLDYGLSFSRFLNKGRASYPKIDFPEIPLAEYQFKKNQNQHLEQLL